MKTAIKGHEDAGERDMVTFDGTWTHPEHGWSIPKMIVPDTRATSFCVADSTGRPLFNVNIFSSPGPGPGRLLGWADLDIIPLDESPLAKRVLHAPGSAHRTDTVVNPGDIIAVDFTRTD